ncbi:hypothetical protein BYT27DRAFT_7249559 [Phlegmacium glaucopus]|nr:hypothetical protein BYT27DRAFT_7249559 [Phlegmacium glaucopus]
MDDEDDDDGPEPQPSKMTTRWLDVSDSEPAGKLKWQTRQKSRPNTSVAEAAQNQDAAFRHLQDCLDALTAKTDCNIEIHQRLLDRNNAIYQWLMLHIKSVENQLDVMESTLKEVLERVLVVEEKEAETSTVDSDEDHPMVVAGQPAPAPTAVQEATPSNAVSTSAAVPAAALSPAASSDATSSVATSSVATSSVATSSVATSSVATSSVATPSLATLVPATPSTAALVSAAEPPSAAPVTPAIPSPADPPAVEPDTIAMSQPPIVNLQPPTPQTSQEALESSPHTLVSAVIGLKIEYLWIIHFS